MNTRRRHDGFINSIRKEYAASTSISFTSIRRTVCRAFV